MKCYLFFWVEIKLDAKMYGKFCGISLIHSALFGLQLPLQLYTVFAEFLG